MKQISEQTTTGRTQAELLFNKLDSLMSDINHYVEDNEIDTDGSPFMIDAYDNWLRGADGMRAILAIEHLLEEEG